MKPFIFFLLLAAHISQAPAARQQEEVSLRGRGTAVRMDGGTPGFGLPTADQIKISETLLYGPFRESFQNIRPFLLPGYLRTAIDSFNFGLNFAPGWRKSTNPPGKRPQA